MALLQVAGQSSADGLHQGEDDPEHLFFVFLLLYSSFSSWPAFSTASAARSAARVLIVTHSAAATSYWRRPSAPSPRGPSWLGPLSHKAGALAGVWVENI